MKNITKAIASLLIAMITIFILSGCGGGGTPGNPDQNGTDVNQTVPDQNGTDNQAVEKTAIERLVGINIGPGEKAALIDGHMQKVQDECPGDANGVWQSGLERHFHYEINPDNGEHVIAFCSPNSPFKVKVNGEIRDDYTLLVLSGDKKQFP